MVGATWVSGEVVYNFTEFSEKFLDITREIIKVSNGNNRKNWKVSSEKPDE